MLPSLHQLPLPRHDASGDVGVILDDPDMPRDAFKMIEQLSLGPVRCMVVEWGVMTSGDVRNRHVLLTVNLKHSLHLHAEGRAMANAIDAAFAARGGPVPISKDFEDSELANGATPQLELTYILKWTANASSTHGISFPAIVALMPDVVATFAASTDRRIQNSRTLHSAPGFMERRLRLCARPNEAGFLGTFVAKTLRPTVQPTP